MSINRPDHKNNQIIHTDEELTLTSSNQSTENISKTPPLILKSALQYVLDTCLTANNRISDIEKSGEWPHFLDYRYRQEGQWCAAKTIPMNNDDSNVNKIYHPETKKFSLDQKSQWYYKIKDPLAKKVDYPQVRLQLRSLEHPLAEKQFNLTSAQVALLKIALLVSVKRSDNCGGRSCLMAKYLWEHSTQSQGKLNDAASQEEIRRIELFSTTTFDHTFIVVNRTGDTLDNAGENCWIIDSWYEKKGQKGLIFPAKELAQKIKDIKEFALKQAEELTKLGYPSTPISLETKERYRCISEIQPAIHHYPSYPSDPFRPLEDYYIVLNQFPANDLKLHVEGLRKQKIKFKDCLDELKTTHNKKHTK